MDGADGRVVERREGAFDGVRRLGACLGRGGPRLELLAHALAQLAGGLLGERDGGHGAHVAGARLGVEHAPDVAVDEHARLAGAGPGLEQEGGAEVAGDAVADVLVADHALRRRHRRSPPRGPLRCRPTRSASSSCSRLRARVQSVAPQA